MKNLKNNIKNEFYKCYTPIEILTAKYTKAMFGLDGILNLQGEYIDENIFAFIVFDYFEYYIPDDSINETYNLFSILI